MNRRPRTCPKFRARSDHLRGDQASAVADQRRAEHRHPHHLVLADRGRGQRLQCRPVFGRRPGHHRRHRLAGACRHDGRRVCARSCAGARRTSATATFSSPTTRSSARCIRTTSCSASPLFYRRRNRAVGRQRAAPSRMSAASTRAVSASMHAISIRTRRAIFSRSSTRARLCRELEHTFVTNSRLPDMVALDLRAQIGAINAAKRRLVALLDERGAPTVRAVMRRSLDLAERQLRDRIRRAAAKARGSAKPGWMATASARTGCTASSCGSPAKARRCISISPAPRRRSTPPSTAPITRPSPARRCRSIRFICQGDIDWNDGVKRCLKVTAPAGTVVNATFPAPVSICTIGFRWLVTVAAVAGGGQDVRCLRAISATASARRGACPPTATICSA